MTGFSKSRPVVARRALAERLSPRNKRQFSFALRQPESLAGQWNHQGRKLLKKPLSSPALASNASSVAHRQRHNTSY